MNTFQLIRLITDSPKQALTSNETFVLMIMALTADSQGKNISPGIKKLSAKTKLCEKTIKTILSSLVRKRVLICCPTRKHGSHEKSSYEFNINIFEEFNRKINSSSRVTVTPETGVTVTPEKHNSEFLTCNSYTRSRVTVTPETGVTVTPTPYIQLLEPILEPKYVELGANSTSLPSLEKLPKIKKSWNPEIDEIFRHWQKVMNHPMSKLDDARKNKIMKALKLGYEVEELKKAIDGAKKSSFHMGGNESGTIYDSISLIFRNPEKIETFICKFDTEGAPKNKNGATALKPTFLDNNRNQLEAMNEIEKKFFPQYLKSKPSNIKSKEVVKDESE